MTFHSIDFTPFWGLSSKHLQMIVAAYTPKGDPPPSRQWLIDIGDGDQLSCEVSTPKNWNHQKTIVLIHGLGGSYTSGYMIRMARKFYERGQNVVRINLRGCGSGIGLSKLPCGAGNSKDLLKVLQELKKNTPESDIILMGFSLGGNTSLKLAGELGIEAEKIVKKIIAVCPPLDLRETVRLIELKKNWIYHKYYLDRITKQSAPWIKQKVNSIYEYDDRVTGPLWGFKDALEYYEKCSCIRFLSQIRCETHIIFAEDDPFVSLDPLKTVNLPKQVHIWTSKYGSHLGFLGRTPFQWMDEFLLNQV